MHIKAAILREQGQLVSVESAELAPLETGEVLVQGAVLAGASRIIAIDRQEQPLAMAKTLGATDLVRGGEQTNDAVAALAAGAGGRGIVKPA